MKTTPELEELLKNIHPKILKGEGCSIELLFPFVVRYKSEGRQLTLPIEVKQKEGSWWIFGLYISVYVEMPICWDDDDTPINTRQAEVILAQIEEMLLRHKGKKYELTMAQKAQ